MRFFPGPKSSIRREPPVGEFYKNLIKKGPALILRDNTIIIHINLRWHLYIEKHNSASILKEPRKTTNKNLQP